jgi:hypothetical protein
MQTGFDLAIADKKFLPVAHSEEILYKSSGLVKERPAFLI